MLNDIKCCNIIYGYTEDFISCYNDSQIILIEPRKNTIDKIDKLKLDNNIIIIKKVLVNNKSLSEEVLYYDKINDNYWLRQNDLTINGTNCFNINKESVYTISLIDLINKYKIQNIKNLVLNININNNSEILNGIVQFNHIISYIKVKNDFKCDFFNNFYKKINDKILNDIVYVHKNLNIKLPKIGIYFNDLKLNSDINKLILLLHQYQMGLIITESNIETNIIEYPDSIDKLNDIYKKPKTNNKKNTQIFYDKLISDLDIIFNDKKNNKESIIKSDELIFIMENESDDIDNGNNFDIIIQFNPKYFELNNTLQIMYPLKNNIIYINKMYDIIYGTKNCMYMLYQIIKSKYFSDYLDNKKSRNPKLFKLMSKRYFYEYIDKIFDLKYF